MSALASPSANELARLQDLIVAEGVPAIFVGTTVSPRIAEQIAGDVGVQVVRVYTGSLSGLDGPASTYMDFMRYNVTAIVDALR
jgi:ABC-type Zn uptake system ZnuABC Zn-binding protein ZnuA